MSPPRSRSASNALKVSLREVSDLKAALKRVEAELGGNLRLQSLLADISATFVAAPSERIDAAIESTQRRIVEALRLDRSTLWQLADDSRGLVLTHSWTRPPWPPLPVGIAVSNWRHAIIALLGAFIANALAVQAHTVGGAINFGFVGFNGVLAALAGFSLILADIRMAIFASLLATWLASYVYRGFPAPMLASGLVLAIWLILFLGWLNPRFNGSAPKVAAAN